MQIEVIKKISLSLIGILILQAAFSQPVIQSFSPSSGPIGSEVIIKGSGFSSTPANNIVHFGAVKSRVVSASVNSLSVIVPAGASYEPITVTSGSLTCYAALPFNVTFPGAGEFAFSKDLFNRRIDAAIDNSDPDNGFGYYAYFTIVDLDDDGKPDMISSNSYPKTISVIRNKSSVGAISFEQHREYSTADPPSRIDHADMDGDGKQDIVVICGKTVSIFKNTSTIGNISFATRFDIAFLSPAYEDIAINDVNRDAKPDFAVTGVNSQTILIFKNTSSNNNISFEKSAKIQVPYGYEYLALKDLDGDSYPDLCLSYWGSKYSLQIAKNKSTPDSISFGELQIFNTVRGARDIDLGDLDGDGKLDIVVPNNQAYNFSVFKNTSSANSINFEENTDFRVGRFPQRLAIGDLDGNGKPDVAVSDNEHIGFTVSIYKNLTTSNGIDFAPQQDLLGLASDEVAVADMDGDGMPEIEVVGTEYSLICVFTRCPLATINQQPKDASICIKGDTSFSVVTTDTAAGYQWQIQKGAGWINLTNNSLYNGVNNSILHLTDIDTSMNGYLYRCVIFSKCMIINSDSALLTAKYPSPPSLIIKTSDTLICPSTKVIFTAYTRDGGTNPVYQWKKNNLDIGANTPVYTDSLINEGDIITCILTSDASCLSINTGISNIITMHVTSQLIPEISITASSNSICSGSTVNFNSTTINAGATPSFQWIKNNAFVGNSSNVYKDSSLKDGDSIICILTPDLTCSTGNVKSNSIVINVNPLITPSISIIASKNNICPKDVIEFASAVSNEGNNAIYNWIKNGIDAGNNFSHYTDSLFKEGDTVMCILHSEAAGCLTTNVVNSNKIVMHLQNLPGKADLGPDKNICPGSTIILSTSYTYNAYIWQNNTSSSTLVVAAPGVYHVYVTDACGGASSDTITVTQYTVPASFLPADTSVCNYDHIIISPNQSFNKYLWSNGATTSVIDVTTPGIYWLQATNNNNCTVKDSITVAAKDCMHGVYVSSAFTPNGDGKNDLFKPQIFGTLEQYQFNVYNRFGQQVFHTTEAGKGWDGAIQGKQQNTGVFVWVCIFKLRGETLTKKTGTVVLMH